MNHKEKASPLAAPEQAGRVMTADKPDGWPALTLRIPLLSVISFLPSVGFPQVMYGLNQS